MRTLLPVCPACDDARAHAHTQQGARCWSVSAARARVATAARGCRPLCEHTLPKLLHSLLQLCELLLLLQSHTHIHLLLQVAGLVLQGHCPRHDGHDSLLHTHIHSAIDHVAQTSWIAQIATTAQIAQRSRHLLAVCRCVRTGRHSTRSRSRPSAHCRQCARAEGRESAAWHSNMRRNDDEPQQQLLAGAKRRPNQRERVCVRVGGGGCSMAQA